MLHGHCDAAGRDPATVTVTNLSEAAVLGGSADATERDGDVVGTVEEHVGRYRRYAEAGVDEAIVALRLDGTPAQVEAFAAGHRGVPLTGAGDATASAAPRAGRELDRASCGRR